MHFPLPFLIQFLLCSLPLAPATALLIHPRSHYCSNAPSTKAGTHLPRTLPPTTPRSPSQPPSTIWCSPGSSTWLQLSPTSPIPGPTLFEILDQSYAFIMHQIATSGDGVILGGMFTWYGREGRALSVINADNHQCTWGVLGAAVQALGEWVRAGEGVGGGEAGGGWRGCYFVVSDGMREVGLGTLG